MRFRMLLIAAVCLALAVSPASLADGHQGYVDSVGENPAALDIAHIDVSNSSDGIVRVLIGFQPMSNLPSGTDLVLLLDTDQNADTGDGNGMEYAVWMYGSDNTYEFLHWNGTAFERAGELHIVNLPILGVLIEIDQAQIGGVGAFDFAVATLRGPTDAPIIDQAPDDTRWTYTLDLTPVIDTVVPHFAPAQPSAGHAFTVGARVKLETGEVFDATAVRCTAELAGRALRGAAAGGCRFAIPRDAHRKRLTVHITAGYQDADPVTTTVTLRVR